MIKFLKEYETIDLTKFDNFINVCQDNLPEYDYVIFKNDELVLPVILLTSENYLYFMKQLDCYMDVADNKEGNILCVDLEEELIVKLLTNNTGNQIWDDLSEMIKNKNYSIIKF